MSQRYNPINPKQNQNSTENAPGLASGPPPNNGGTNSGISHHLLTDLAQMDIARLQQIEKSLTSFSTSNN